MSREFHVNIESEYGGEIDMDSLKKLDSECQNTKRKERKSVVYSHFNSCESTGRTNNISLFDDNLLNQINLMIDYLSSKED